jgi:taurine--2-oxoglutarate transaminase
MLWVCPPLIINEEELRQGLDIVEEALHLLDGSMGKASVARTGEPVGAR